MKKRAILFYAFLIFFLMAGAVQAGGPDVNPAAQNPAAAEIEQGKPCAMSSIKSASWENVDPELPYLLQQDLKSCLDKCTQEFNSCMNGAGDSDSAQFRCGEKRWMCTRSCDNQWESKLES